MCRSSGHSVITISFDMCMIVLIASENYGITMVHVQKHGISMVLLCYSISLLLLWAQEDQLP